MPEFLSTLRCFQDRTCNVEQAFGGSSWSRCTPLRKELAFVLKYPEHNGRSDGADPWSIRQTGIYQSHDARTQTSLCILLNPKPKSAADARLRDLLDAHEAELEQQRPSRIIGLTVFATYFSNWRTYMAYYEKEEIRMSNIVITSLLTFPLQPNHTTLTNLRRLESRFLLLPPLLNATIQSLQLLSSFTNALYASAIITPEEHSSIQEILTNYTKLAESYLQNAVFLLSKTSSTAQLLSDTLSLNHQRTAHDISANTLALTNATVQDSATIRVITLVTMLYLPASFVATLFGMQFFTTDPSGKLTIASSQLWIFFALAAPFTAATFGYWKWMDGRMRRKGRDRNERIKVEAEASEEV